MIPYMYVTLHSTHADDQCVAWLIGGNRKMNKVSMAYKWATTSNRLYCVQHCNAKIAGQLMEHRVHT